MLDFTVMLDELMAVTDPVKSSMVSTTPGGRLVRTVVVAVKTFGWVKSTPMPPVVTMAVLRFTSRPIHCVTLALSVTLTGAVMVVAPPLGSWQTAPFRQEFAPLFQVTVE